MTLRRTAICAIALCLCAGGAAAIEPVMVLSYGANNCERFLRAPHTEKLMYLSWAEGFISAANMGDAGASRMAGMFWNQAVNTAWLQSYCTLNPKDGFVAAATALRTSLGGHKPK